jgi:hypothetical protein
MAVNVESKSTSGQVKLALMVYVMSGWLTPLLVDQLRVDNMAMPMGSWPNLSPMLTNTLSMVLAWYCTPTTLLEKEKKNKVVITSSSSSSSPAINGFHHRENEVCWSCFSSLQSLLHGRNRDQWKQLLRITFFDFSSGGETVKNTCLIYIRVLKRRLGEHTYVC